MSLRVTYTWCPNFTVSSFAIQYPLDICRRKCFIISASLAAVRKHLLSQGIPFDSSFSANMQFSIGCISFTHPLWNALGKLNIYLSCLSEFCWQSLSTSTECCHPESLTLLTFRNECQHLNSPCSHPVLRITTPNSWNPPLTFSLDLRTHWFYWKTD